MMLLIFVPYTIGNDSRDSVSSLLGFEEVINIYQDWSDFEA